MRTKHFKELDGVRGIAALMVMFFHFFQILDPKTHLLLVIKKFSAFGQTGVSLFFVLSGFLITRILINTRRSNSYFSTFYIRRALRIFPLYFLFLVIYYFLIPFFDHTVTVPVSQQIWYWVYLQNIAITFNWPVSGPGHFWSLAVEEHFYIFWPILIFFFDKRKIKMIIAGIIILSFASRYYLIKNNFSEFYFTFSRMDELAIGAFLSILEIEGKLKHSTLKKFVILFCIIIIPTLILWSFTSGLRIDAIQVCKYLLLSLSYCSLLAIVLTIKDTHWAKKLLRLSVFSYTGKISYGLYVYHPLCFYYLIKYLKFDSVLILFITSFCFSYLIASVSYYLFESKFLLLKRRFDYSRLQKGVITDNKILAKSSVDY